MSSFVDRIRHQFSHARPAKRAGLILLVLAAFSVVGTSAWAYWTTHGIGSASASTGTLYAPDAPVASVTGPGTVHLTWNTSTLSNNTAAQGYYVTRSDAPDTKLCETSGTPIGDMSCDDTSVGQGTYTYKVTAVYGSWTASSGESNTIIGTTTTVTSSRNPSVAGQTVLYTATVTQNSGVATPTGSVTFKDGTSMIDCTGGSAKLSLGVTTCQIAYTGVGTHSITAVYSGDAEFLASTSSVLTQAVNKADTSTSVVSSSNPSVVGQSVTYTATVAVSAPGAGTPTGNVEFFDGATAISGCGGTTGNALSGTTATCSVSYATVSSHPITAQYLGSTDFNASAASASLTQAVNKADTSTSVVSSSNPSVVGQSVTYTATVAVSAPGAGTPTGTVTFKDGTSTIACTGGSTTLSSGVATCTLASTGVASHSITAEYPGDTNFLTSTSSAITQVINQAGTSTALTSLVNPSVVGQSVTYTATVIALSPGAGTPTGTVTFKDGTSTIVCTGGSTTLSLGVATCQIGYAGVGTHSITAVYGSDTNFLTSTSSVITQTVSSSLAIATVANDHGNIKVYFTGTGAAASTTITVTICALNSFPCAIPISFSTASNPPAGNWTSAQSSANLTAGTTYYAQAVQGTTSSTVFSFLPPP